MVSTTAFQQYRRVEAGDGGIDVVQQGDLDDTHMAVSITHGEKGNLSAEVTIWNLKRSSWGRVERGDPYKITLGYPDYRNVCIIGSITSKRPAERDGSDFKYTFSGPDESAARVQGTYLEEGHTWQDVTITQAVRDIAGFCGLSPGYIDAPAGTLKGRYCILPEHSMRHWLNRLADEARDRGGEEYKWYARSGQLFFLPKNEPTEEAIRLDDDPRTGNLKLLEPADVQKKSSGGDALEFEAILDPNVAKDAIVMVSHSRHGGSYRVSNYELSSSTATGDHEMSGTLVPTDTNYEVVPTTPPHRGPGGFHVRD